jgi:hypothetical protein
MSENRTNFKALEAEFNKLHAQFKAEAESILKETFKYVFDKNPNVTAIVWSQYTPYFNDGDSCLFSVNDIHFTNVKDLDNISNGGWPELDMDTDDEDYEDTFMIDNVKYYHNPSNHRDSGDEELVAVLKANLDVDSCSELVSMMSSSLMEDVAQSLFGDHVMVVATREGFDIRDIDHE